MENIKKIKQLKELTAELKKNRSKVSTITISKDIRDYAASIAQSKGIYLRDFIEDIILNYSERRDENDG